MSKGQTPGNLLNSSVQHSGFLGDGFRYFINKANLPIGSNYLGN